MKPNNTKLLFSYLLTLLISFFVMLAGINMPNSPALLISLAVISVLPLIALALNFFLSMRFMKKIKSMKIAEGNAFLLSHRDDAEKTAAEKLKQLRRIRHATSVYTVFLFVAAAAIALLGGVMGLEFPPAIVICTVYAWLVMASAALRIHIRKKIDLTKDIAVLSPEEYPLIYAMARKAADAVGSKEEIIILPNWDFSASIIRDKGRYLLRVGVVLLHVLSEEELYSIMLHEFAHVREDKNKHFREEQYQEWLSSEGGGVDRLSAFLANFYLHFGAKYLFNYMIYRYACSVVYELEADRAMAEHGDAKIAVSALLKTHYDTLFYWESCVNEEPNIYESEELKADYLTGRIKLFKDAIEKRNSEWNALVQKEILANNASHPTLKMRMDALEIDELTLTETQSSQAYLDEIQKILEYSEGFIYEDRKQNYEKERKEYYLDPLERINAWKQSGEKILPETYADLIADLKTLGRHREAEMLCDRVREELPDSATHATFIKGAMMLYRYDEKGMDLIYQAMERNGNYIEEGLDTIGNFCCLTGREEDLQEYRKKANLLAQKHVDEDEQISFLSKSDKLSKENLPDGMLEDILGFMRSIDEHQIMKEIYLVRKTVSDTFFASVFVIRFDGGTQEEQGQIMHKIFRYLDCYPVDWQFSLFDRADYPDVKIESIEGSLVFKK